MEYSLLARSRNTVILSDSMSVLQALCRFPFKTPVVCPIILEIRIFLVAYSLTGLSVVFSWIPGYSGIYGNDPADQLANDAIVTQDIAYYYNYNHDLVTFPIRFLRQD